MFALIFLAATVSAVPNLDIDKICKSAADIPGNQDPIAGCLNDEKAAKERLIKAWPTYPPASREDCTSELKFGVGVSYVEIETCFQIQDWKTHLQDIGGEHVPGAHGPQLQLK